MLCGGLLLLFASGCTNLTTVQAEKLDSVRVGMTRDELLALMGSPQRQEIHGSTEFWIYSSDGSSPTALLDFAPIAIVNGRVTGTGRSLYDAVVKAHARDARSRAIPD